MRRYKVSLAFYLLAVLASIFFLAVPMVQAQNGRPALITQSPDESNLVTLAGNTRPEVKATYDRGLVADSFPMEHMLLQLKRSPEQERELQQIIDELTDPSSPNFHHWLTAKEFGERFGLVKQDLDTITRWLESHGFRVNVVYENGVLIDFSGTAGQVRAAFHTEIHKLDVKGEKHIANMSDPRIPAALAPAVVGVVSLHDFLPRPMYKPRANYTYKDPMGYPLYGVVPADLATIYNLNPLFSVGLSGQGQTIVVLEDSDVYSTADWTTFRSTFGLSSYTGGSFTEIHPAPPSGTNNCTDPGVNANGNDSEATLDAEWASASAPSAAIELASCKDTTTFGGLFALQNLLNASSTPPALVSISYGECEAINGASSNAAYNAAYQQAATEGVSVFVAAGDEGASLCSAGQHYATYGIGVSGFASTPYNVAVGGTDFGDSYADTNSTYWGGNTSTYGSALSYIPEIPWNDSCASTLVATYEGYPSTYGSNGFCNSTTGQSFWDITAGGGGPSGCATGSPLKDGVVDGSCAGWPKPSWQSLVGNPSDRVRDIPDVSLFAADGLWWHFYIFCWSDTVLGGASCSGNPSTWMAGGGTSFSSPIMAGIQALVNQSAGGPQGNPNPVYYRLAASEYGASGNSSCNSTLGNTVGSSCIFYDVTQGDMDLPCTGLNCYDPSGAIGVLSTLNSEYQPAYGTTTGWDFATGIGTLNAANLANNWSEASSPSFTLASSPASVNIAQGGSGTSTITVTPQNGFSASVTLSATGLPSGVTASFSANPTTSTSTLTFMASATAVAGTVTVTINGNSGTLTNSTTLSLTVTSTPPSFSLSASPNAVAITIVGGAGSGTSTIAVVPDGGFSGNVTVAASGLPKGVTAAFNPNPAVSTSVLTLTAGSTAKAGTATVTITGTSGSLSSSTTIALTVKPLGNFTLVASPKTLTVAQGSSGTSTITITPTDTFDQNVTLTASGLPSGVTASFGSNPATSSSTLTLAVSNSAAVGTATITITGTSGSLVHTTAVKLKTVMPNFTLTALPKALTVAPGSSGTSTVTITPTNTFDQNVTLSASGLPAGVTALFSPNPATSSSTLTLAVSDSATAGKSAITITGTAGSLSHVATVELTVSK
jgi:hypothetical protein